MALGSGHLKALGFASYCFSGGPAWYPRLHPLALQGFLQHVQCGSHNNELLSSKAWVIEIPVCPKSQRPGWNLQGFFFLLSSPLNDFSQAQCRQYRSIRSSASCSSLERTIGFGLVFSWYGSAVLKNLENRPYFLKRSWGLSFLPFLALFFQSPGSFSYHQKNCILHQGAYWRNRFWLAHLARMLFYVLRSDSTIRR